MTSLLVERGVFDLAEGSDYLHLNATELRHKLQTGEIPGWRTGGASGHWRLSKAAADEWIALQEERGRMEVRQ